MKKTIKIISLILAVALIAGILVSCKKKRTGILLATYDGKDEYDGKVYSGDEDLVNWLQYLNQYYYDYLEDGTISKEAFGEVVIQTVLLHRLEELDLKDQDITVSEEEIKEIFEYNKLNFDEFYDGGFEEAKKAYGLDDDFWMQYARYRVITNIIIDDQLLKLNVSESELKEYFSNNYGNYIQKAGYDYTAVFVEVKDVTDDAEWTTEKANAQAYIDRIKAGEKFEDVYSEILKKYSVENGYTQASYASGFGTVELSKVADVTDLEEALAKASENFPKADRTADKESEEYKDYMRYLSTCMGIEQSYAMKNMQIGEIYPTPIRTPFGWMILRLDEFREKSIYPLFDDVSAQVYADYCQELVENNTILTKYKESLFNKYNIKIEEYQFG